MKFKPRVTSHESRATNKAFTLIELVVTIAILTMVISFTSVIFNVSIDAHRTSAASAEIMQKFRAITDQLNRDFRSLQKDAPLLIWFHDPLNNNRFDQIMFFAAGDFQSTQLYDGSPAYPTNTGSPLVGNVARVHYAQAQPDPNLLARRRHILTAGPYIKWFGVGFAGFDGLETVYNKYKNNDFYEHDSNSLAWWKIADGVNYDNIIIPTCFEFRPLIDKGDPNTFHNLMCEGVGSFAVQWAYWYDAPVPALSKFRWFPETQYFDSGFGVHFNIPNATTNLPWYVVEDVEYATGQKFEPGFYPRALKFTFTLYDSKGIIKNGREFTHIVYLDN